MNATSVIEPELTYQRIFKTWWPLAVSWLLMAGGGPVVSAVIARLNNPEINLAAYGGMVFPISVVIGSPIIMLLAASTALCKDWESFIKLRRFMMISAGILSTIHILVAFTPLYYIVVEDIIGAPPEIIGPGRVGLMLMTPWSGAIAYRRFHQGVLIRFGSSDAIVAGTVIRLFATCVGLAIGYSIGVFSGIVVGAGSEIFGVVIESIYTGWRTRPVLHHQLKLAQPVEPLIWRTFFKFYIPLALTSLLMFFWQPIGSAGLSRMPRALDSLAVWPILTGLIFLLRSSGMAYNEVAIALLDERSASIKLRRFTFILASIVTLLHLLVAATPASRFWFVNLSGLDPQLAELAELGIWLTLPLPALTVLQNWYQGMIVHNRQTRGIPESVSIFLFTVTLILAAGIIWGQHIGLYIGMIAFTIANIAQTLWLWYRSRPIMRELKSRDVEHISAQRV